VDTTAPAASVVALVAELPAFGEPRLVVRHAAPNMPDPVPPSATPQLRTQVQSIRATCNLHKKFELLAELGVRRRGTNPSVRALYERVATVDPSRKVAELSRGIVHALRATHSKRVAEMASRALVQFHDTVRTLAMSNGKVRVRYMATVWAARVGKWSSDPSTGWSHTIQMTALPDLPQCPGHSSPSHARATW
jgi:hypothetical protein